MVGAALLFGLALEIALTVACDSFIGHEVIRFFGSRKARRGVDSADPVRQVTAISAMFDSKKNPAGEEAGRDGSLSNVDDLCLVPSCRDNRCPIQKVHAGQPYSTASTFRFRPKK
jgi:hypothetical protein